jgi:transcription initiation factor IIE alpha subunit
VHHFKCPTRAEKQLRRPTKDPLHTDRQKAEEAPSIKETPKAKDLTDQTESQPRSQLKDKTTKRTEDIMFSCPENAASKHRQNHQARTQP